MRGFIGRNGRIYSSGQRCAMFAKQRMTDEQEMMLSDKIATAVGDVPIERSEVIFYVPEMKAVTGSTSGGKIAHLHFKRSEPAKEGMIYIMDDKGVAEAKLSL